MKEVAKISWITLAGEMEYKEKDGDIFEITTREESSNKWGFYHETCTPKELVLMQYIGILDKRNKEIYQGDVILVNTEVPGEDDTFRDYRLVVGDFVRGGFGYEQDKLDGVDFENRTSWLQLGELPPEAEIKILGNIYENPELLK